MKDKNVYETDPIESLEYKGYYHIPKISWCRLSVQAKMGCNI